ncbi:MAG: hypothetical protein LBQ79_06550 [Deltaproteobacteria bacterium]|jgi:Sec-independent protein translocase protein TatA|nr:hypothetical protein [Deltaproteobacteria bacterium]
MAPGLGYTEIAFILLLALILIKPRDLPGVLRSAARFWREARRVLWGMRDSLMKELDEIRNMDGIRDIQDLKGMDEMRALGDLGESVGLKDLHGPVSARGGAGGDAGGGESRSGDGGTTMEEIYPELGKVPRRGGGETAAGDGFGGLEGQGGPDIGTGTSGFSGSGTPASADGDEAAGGTCEDGETGRPGSGDGGS